MKLVATLKVPSCDALMIPLFQGESLPAALKTELGTVAKLIETHQKAKDFEGEEGQSLILYPEKSSAHRVILWGRGKKEDQVPQATENCGAKLARLAKSQKCKTVTLACAESELEEMSTGFVLGTYEFMRYKKVSPKAVKIETANWLTEKATQKSAQKTLDKVMIFEEGSILVRDLINTCGGDLDTKSLTQEAQSLAKKNKFTCTIFEEKKLKAMGCGGLIGIGKGAQEGPRMVILEYRNGSKSKRPNIAFIGKGITFDSGGMNLKPYGHIETMKLDMAGAVTVMATLQALKKHDVKGYFIGVLCIAENAISDRCLHSGDVVTMYNGKTVEVVNTDGEGRMVLADGMAYAEKHYAPLKMVDVATLTGAALVALGYPITAVLGNDQAFIDQSLAAAKAAHERQWPLPLDKDFIKLTKGDYSDLKNATDGVRAGVIMGAAFLSNFVEKTPWIHYDIAGPAWVDRPTPTTSYGATAASLRTLIELGIQNAG